MKKTTKTRVSGTLDPLVRARIKADKAWSAAYTAELAWRVAAKSRTPEEWRKAVDGIADKLVRIQTACIVWWDYFGSRPASDPWPHLDDYKAAWKNNHNANVDKVREMLMQVGYPKRIADLRVKVEESDAVELTPNAAICVETHSKSQLR